MKLECTGKGDPLPEIIWKIRETVLRNTQENKIESEIGFDGAVVSKFTKSNVRTFDGGLYSCVARNKVGEDIYSKNIDVYGPPHVWPIANKTVVAGDSFFMHCHVSGYPIKSITWLKGNLLKLLYSKYYL